MHLKKYYKMKVLKFIVAIFLLSSNILLAQGSWIKISKPTDKNLKSVFFIDSLVGFIAGDSGIILKTTNGGNSFHHQQSNLTTTIHNLFFTDSIHGWGLTWHQNEFGPYGTTFLFTTNGGETWTNFQYPKDFTFLYSIFFKDTLNGFVCGEPGLILKTTNGGLEWVETKIATNPFSNFPIVKIDFLNESFGLGCGGVRDIFGVIWQTSDGGENWSAQAIGPEPIMDFQIIDTNFVMAVGGDYEYGCAVGTSFDKGQTWYYRTLNVFGIGNSIAFRTPYEGWINLYGESKFLVSTDSGSTWSEYLVVDSLRPNKIIFTDSLHGYAVCDSGYVLKYIPPQQTNVETSFQLNQKNDQIKINIFPNPFNSVTNIKITSKHLITMIELYNLLGEKIKDYSNFNSSQKEISLMLNGNELSSGTYIIVVKSVDGIVSEKIILIK